MEFGETLGTLGALRVYQRAVQQVWQWLRTEEKARAKETATSWNVEKGPPDSVKARYGNTIWHGFHALNTLVGMQLTMGSSYSTNLLRKYGMHAG